MTVKQTAETLLTMTGLCISLEALVRSLHQRLSHLPQQGLIVGGQSHCATPRETFSGTTVGNGPGLQAVKAADVPTYPIEIAYESEGRPTAGEHGLFEGRFASGFHSMFRVANSRLHAGLSKEVFLTSVGGRRTTD